MNMENTTVGTIEARSKCIEPLRPRIEKFPVKTDDDIQIACVLQSKLNESPLSATRFSYFHRCPFCIPSIKTKKRSYVICTNYGQCTHHDKHLYLKDCRKIMCESYNMTVRDDHICCEELIKYNKRVPIIASRLKEQREKCGLSLRDVSKRCWISHIAIFKHENKVLSAQNTIEKSLCYYLAALYGTTPGYLMGQTDDDNTDIYLSRYIFSKKKDYQDVDCKPDPIKIIAVSELSLPIQFFSAQRRAGMEAAQNIIKLVEESYPELKNTELLKFISTGKNIYCTLFPKDIRNALAQFTNAITVHDPFEAMFDGYEVKSRKANQSPKSVVQDDEVNKGDTEKC